jgi:hypothetical protein
VISASVEPASTSWEGKGIRDLGEALTPPAAAIWIRQSKILCHLLYGGCRAVRCSNPGLRRAGSQVAGSVRPCSAAQRRGRWPAAVGIGTHAPLLKVKPARAGHGRGRAPARARPPPAPRAVAARRPAASDQETPYRPISSTRTHQGTSGRHAYMHAAAAHQRTFLSPAVHVVDMNVYDHPHACMPGALAVAGRRPEIDRVVWARPPRTAGPAIEYVPHCPAARPAGRWPYAYRTVGTYIHAHVFRFRAQIRAVVPVSDDGRSDLVVYSRFISKTVLSRPDVVMCVHACVLNTFA